MKLTTKPYPFQEEGIEFLLEHHYAILGDEMGLGKSLQAIGVACKVKAKRILIVCPAYLKTNWVHEFLAHTDEKNLYAVPTSAKIGKASYKEARVVVVSYSMVHMIKETFDAVIVDECQYLKNMGAKRTKAFHELIEHFTPDRLMLLSGTPIKNRIPEFYSLLVLCSYNPYGTSGLDVKKSYKTEFAFSKYFCVMTQFRVGFRTVTKFHGAKNIPRLKSLLKDKFKRRLSKNVLDLPPFIDKRVLITTNNDKELEKEWKKFLVEGGKLHNSVRKAESALLKSKFTIKYCTELLNDQQGPLVVFCDHVKSATAIANELSERFKVRLITGSVPTEKRADYSQMFQNGQLDVIVATFGSASTGYTWTKAQDMVINSFPWVGADLAQAKKRIHRIGQEGSVRFHFMLGSPVDEEILEAVQTKQEAIKEVL